MVELNLDLLVPVLAIIISALSLYKSGKKTDTDEIAKRAADNAIVNTKLDQIGTDVRDIKYDVTAVKKDIARLDKEIAVVRASAHSAHKRLDSAGIGRADDGEEKQPKDY